MKLIKTLAFALPVITCSAVAHQHQGDYGKKLVPYVGLGISSFEYSEESTAAYEGADAGLIPFFLVAGLELNKYLATETRIGLGLGDRSKTVQGQDYNIRLKRYFGLYLKAGMPIHDKVEPYLIGGMTNAKISGKRFSGTETDLSYGVGVTFELPYGVDGSLEYIDYFSENIFDASGAVFSIVKEF